MSQTLTPYQHGIRARNALWAIFFFMGVVSMGWVPRIPEIKEAVGLTNSQLGLVFIGSTIGAVLGAQLAGRAIHTFGTKNVISVAVLVMPVGLIGMASARTFTELFFALFVLGFGYANLDITSNTVAVEVENLVDRKWMVSFHGCWSTGAFATTVLGGSIANFVEPRENLIGVALVSILFFIPLSRYMLSPDLDNHKGDHEDSSAKIPLFGKKTAPLWWMGFGMLGGMIAEGSASDWGALLLKDSMGIGKGLNAAAFASFSLAMIISRFSGDWALTKFGPAATVRIGGYGGALIWGSAIAIAVPLSDSHPLPAFIIINIGFAAAGLGIGPMFPAFILAASRIPGIAPGVAIARVGVTGIAGYFIGPTITGFLADIFSLPVAMFYPVALLAMAGFLSRVIKV
ncbi:MFS transporter [Candidatus Planktophila dulcis]|uniref:MFS transporter n=1 Tax=Candidatus Planktophila dulcis TaxID=1884914 RepID=UPI003BEEB251